MNAKNILSGKEVPHAECFTAFWKHHPVADQAADSLQLSTSQFYQQVPSDFIKLTPAGNYQVAERGGIAHWKNDALGRRTFSKRFVKSENDLRVLVDVPLALTHLEKQIVVAAKLLMISEKRPVYVTVFPPLTQLLMLSGKERLLKSIEKCPELVSSVLHRLTEITKLLIFEYIKVGISHFYIAFQHRSETVIPVKDYVFLADRSDAAIIDFLRCEVPADERYPHLILHFHGNQAYLDDVPDDENIVVHFELTKDNPSLSEFCEKRSNELVVGLPLDFWERCSIDEMCRKIKEVQCITQQRRTIFAAPCVVPLAVPVKSIATWIDKFRAAISILS